MEFFLKNLGPLRQARFSLNDMTIICGENSTGKTYAAYALYGFLDFWLKSEAVAISEEDIQRIMQEGNIELDIQKYIDSAPGILESICEKYTARLSKVFSSREEYFSKSSFSAKMDMGEIPPLASHETILTDHNNPESFFSVKIDEHCIRDSLLSKADWMSNHIKGIIRNQILWFLFRKSFPSPFIASVERTGATIFRKELNFSRDKFLDRLGDIDGEEERRKLFSIIQSEIQSDYAKPVKSNIEFARYIGALAKRDSFIAKGKNLSVILTEFQDILGGDYEVTEHDELYYIPKDKQIKLTMAQSSSAVRSLLLIGFYLRHLAREGDLLMIDEPELNLHPKNQRRLARLFARLTKIGIKVFITTHSDYIIKELNTLIMLNSDGKRLRELAEREGYRTDEFMDHTKINVYVAKEAPVMLDGDTKEAACHTLVKAAIDGKRGIELPTFDDTIEDMNRIQEEIFWGGDE